MRLLAILLLFSWASMAQTKKWGIAEIDVFCIQTQLGQCMERSLFCQQQVADKAAENPYKERVQEREKIALELKDCLIENYKCVSYFFERDFCKYWAEENKEEFNNRIPQQFGGDE